MTYSMSTKPALQGLACLQVGREVFPAGLFNAPIKGVRFIAGTGFQALPPHSG